jgi:hypothetical protein
MGIIATKGATDVVLVFYPNDPIEVSFPVPFHKPTKRPPARTRIYIAEIFKTGFADTSEPYYHGINRRHWQACMAYLELIRAWCKSHDARLYMTYLPFKDELGERVPVGYRKQFLMYCQHRCPNYLDLTPALQAIPAHAGYYAIDEHLTPLGHRVIADALLPFLSGSSKGQFLYNKSTL